MATNTQQDLDEESSGHPGFSRLSILRTLRKRRTQILVSWVLFAVVAVVIVRLLPTVYLAEAVVLIDSQKIPEKFVSATVATELEDRIASIRQMLLSGGELKKVIDEFGLYKEQRKTHFEEEILEMMRKDITISLDSVLPGSKSGGAGMGQTKRPGAFRIGYQGPDPALVVKVANRLTDLYVDQNLKSREGQASGTSEFLETQVRDAKKHLDEMEKTVSEFKLLHNGELPQQENTISATLTRLQSELEANRDAMNRAQQTKVVVESSVSAMEATLAAQKRGLDAPGPDGVSGSQADQSEAVARAKASEAMEEQLALLRSRYSESHPDVVRLRNEIDKMTRLEEQRQASAGAANQNSSGKAAVNRTPVRSQPEPPEFARMREELTVFKSQIKGADTELENRKIEQQRILRDIDLYQRRIEHLPIREQEMAQITRDYEISKENYKSLLDKKMAAEMSLDMERRQQSERFVVLDRAQLPEKPIKPNRPLLYAIGSGVALLLAFLVGFGAEIRQNVLLGEWELPPDTPILARLPFIEIPVATPRRPKRESGSARLVVRVSNENGPARPVHPLPEGSLNLRVTED